MTAGAKRMALKRSVNFTPELSRGIESYAAQEGIAFSDAVRKLCELALTSKPASIYDDIRAIVREEVMAAVTDTRSR